MSNRATYETSPRPHLTAVTDREFGSPRVSDAEKRDETMSGAELMGAAVAATQRLCAWPYMRQIFQITPVPGIWTFWPLAAPTKWTVNIED